MLSKSSYPKKFHVSHTTGDTTIRLSYGDKAKNLSFDTTQAEFKKNSAKVSD